MNPTSGCGELKDLLAFSRDNTVTSRSGSDLERLFSYQILHLEILQCTFPFLEKLKGSSETQTGCAYMYASAGCTLLRQRLLTCGNPSKPVFMMVFHYRAYLAKNLATLEVWKLLHYSQVYLLVNMYGKLKKWQSIMFI